MDKDFAEVWKWIRRIAIFLVMCAIATFFILAIWSICWRTTIQAIWQFWLVRMHIVGQGGQAVASMLKI